LGTALCLSMLPWFPVLHWVARIRTLICSSVRVSISDVLVRWLAECSCTTTTEGVMTNRAKLSPKIPSAAQRSEEAEQRAQRKASFVPTSGGQRGRVRERPSSYSPANILAIQRTMGNRVVGRLLARRGQQQCFQRQPNRRHGDDLSASQQPIILSEMHSAKVAASVHAHTSQIHSSSLQMKRNLNINTIQRLMAIPNDSSREKLVCIVEDGAVVATTESKKKVGKLTYAHIGKGVVSQDYIEVEGEYQGQGISSVLICFALEQWGNDEGIVYLGGGSLSPSGSAVAKQYSFSEFEPSTKSEEDDPKLLHAYKTQFENAGGEGKIPPIKYKKIGELKALALQKAKEYGWTFQ
jgi:predicted GNAT family acetyltransferase